jgi:hypothetical protein
LQVPILNDTGSDIQSLYWLDLDALNFNNATYFHNGGEADTVRVHTAMGIIAKSWIQLQMKVVDIEGKSVTNWFWIKVLIQEIYPDCPMQRLSGYEMREHLFFATGRGNTCLCVSKNRSGLLSILPST